MSTILQELSGICDEHRFKEKLLFVPSYSVGHRIGEALARGGHAWINLRFTTVLGFAQEIAGLELAGDGIRLIDSRELFLIMEEIFRQDEKLNGPGAYFKGTSEVSGILKCLADSIHELRMDGFGPAAIDPTSFIVPEKGKALRRLLSGYEEFLARNRLVDEAGLITMASKVLEERKVSSSEKIVMVLSDFGLSRSEGSVEATRHTWRIPGRIERKGSERSVGDSHVTNLDRPWCQVNQRRW